MSDLENVRVAVIATDGFEEVELTKPVQALKKAGATVEVLSLNSGKIQGFQHHEKGQQVEVDRLLDEAHPEEYDAVMLPGGALNADMLRVSPKLQLFLQKMQEENKPFAVICHAPWELISAGLVRGRTLTSYYTIQDDIRNAGGNWVNKEVVVDNNWVSSQQPENLPAFNEEMLKLFSHLKPSTVG